MRSLCVRPFALVVAALAGTLLFAGPAPAKPKVEASPFAPEVKELHEIKLLLEKADHDYKGHRAEAVKQLAEAIHTLHPGHKHATGAAVKGAGKAVKAVEPQPLSDAQLKESIKTLRAVHKQLSSVGSLPAETAAGHVHNAIKELETALKVK
jgi:hypothetical protein